RAAREDEIGPRRRRPFVRKEYRRRARSSAGRVPFGVLADIVEVMGWLSVRRPQGRDVAAAVIFAVLYFGALWVAFKYGWHPANPDYQWQVTLAGAATVAVLLTRERWPVST